MVQVVAPAVALVAGAGEAVDDAEQAEGAGDGAGDVELARRAARTPQNTRGAKNAAARPIGTLIRKVSRQPCDAERVVEAGEPAAEDQADRGAGAGHRRRRRRTRGCAPGRPGRSW